MNICDFIVSLLFHLDQFLSSFIGRYGVLVYLLVFIIIFCETGLFVPFMPGDSLIFACAAFSATGLLNIWIVILICFTSAFLGDTLNYRIGQTVGKKIYAREKSRFIKRSSIDKASEFYNKHGGMAIILSRFIPLVRQCTPFIAGIGKMTYRKFMCYNLLGVTLWVGILSAAGFFFGNIPAVSENFSGAIAAVICISLLPALIIYLKSKLLTKNP